MKTNHHHCQAHSSCLQISIFGVISTPRHFDTTVSRQLYPHLHHYAYCALILTFSEILTRLETWLSPRHYRPTWSAHWSSPGSCVGCVAIPKVEMILTCFVYLALHYWRSCVVAAYYCDRLIGLIFDFKLNFWKLFLLINKT